MLRRTINILALALVAPLALAQISTPSTEQISASDVVTTYEPGKVIIVASETTPDTFGYVLNKSIHYVDKAGHDVDERLVKPGTLIHVYFEGVGPSRVIKRVVIEED